MDLLTANRLQEFRKKNGYSQEVLAQKLGISRQAISKWERAEASPDIDNLMALSEIYGITVDELLNTSSDKIIVANTAKNQRDVKGKLKSILSKANDFGMYPDIARRMFVIPFPLIIVTIYLALSFIFDIWHPLWLIFLTIPIYYRLALACKANNSKVLALLLPIPETVVMLYLSLSIITGGWDLFIFLFLIIPIYYWIAIMIK